MQMRMYYKKEAYLLCNIGASDAHGAAKLEKAVLKFSYVPEGVLWFSLLFFKEFVTYINSQSIMFF